MSACDIHHAIDACSPKEAYERLCTAEHFESGYAPYNGTITTTSIIGEVSHTTYGKNGRVTPASIKKAQKIGDELNDVNKRQCPLGIPEFFESIGAGHATGFKGASGQYTCPLFEFSDEFLAECGDNRWGHLLALIKLI